MKMKEMINIDVEKIKGNPFQPRKDFDETRLQEMVKSIKEHGIIQPIMARRLNDEYQVVAGERRLRAAKMLGLKEVPVIEIVAEGMEIAELSLVENLQRKDLNPVEEFDAFRVLIEKFRLTQEELAARLGKSSTYVANIMRVEKLPVEIKESLKTGEISFGHAKAIMGMENGHGMSEAFKEIIDKGLNVRQAEKLVLMRKDEGKKGGAKKEISVKKVFKDARIFFNEVKRVVGEIRKAGGRAEIMDKETEDYFEIVVRIPKGQEK